MLQITSVSIPLQYSNILEQWGLPEVVTTMRDTD
jgi:hypothetical protein